MWFLTGSGTRNPSLPTKLPAPLVQESLDDSISRMSLSSRKMSTTPSEYRHASRMVAASASSRQNGTRNSVKVDPAHAVNVSAKTSWKDSTVGNDAREGSSETEESSASILAKRIE